MTTKTLHKTTSRYLYGDPMPAEVKQLQNWLSTSTGKADQDPEEKEKVEREILAEVQAHTAYPLFFPKKEAWWKKFQ